VVFTLLAVVQLNDGHLGDSQSETEIWSEGTQAILIGAPLFTVLVSVFAHGYSAAPLAQYLSSHYDRRKSSVKELDRQHSAYWNVAGLKVRTRGMSHAFYKNKKNHHNHCDEEEEEDVPDISPVAREETEETHAVPNTVPFELTSSQDVDIEEHKST